MNGSQPPESTLLALAQLFAAKGFHAVSLSDLETAAGQPYASLIGQFGDKEAMFYAALDYCRGLAPAAAGPVNKRLAALLPTVRKASLNSKLRAVHHKARELLEALDQGRDLS